MNPIAKLFPSIWLLVFFGALAGCNTDQAVVPPTSVSATANPRNRSLYQGRRLLTPSQALSTQVPSFGGAFIEGGVLHVYLSSPTDLSAARGFVRTQLLAQRRGGMPVQFIQGEYSFRALETWVAELLPQIEKGGGIAFLWIDEWKNRLRIGVVNDEARSKVESAIHTLKIPSEGIIVESASYATPTAAAPGQHLRDEIAVLVGGVEIKVQSTHGQTGTLGAIVQLVGSTYALIASHVADSSGNGGGGTVLQDDVGRRIGIVTANPPWTASLGCSAGMKCRLSDAALVLLDRSVSSHFGAIARPSEGPVIGGSVGGSDSFNESNPIILTDDGIHCTVNGCLPIDMYPGDTASKVGITTGWTGGKYLGVAQYQTGSDGLTRVDVMLVEGVDRPGDSGAPVLSENLAKLVGIAFATGTVSGKEVFLASPWISISEELTGSDYTLHSVPPYILGYEAHLMHPSECPDNPDAWNMYLIKGYPDGQGGYETGSSDYMGNTGYTCAGTTRYGDFQSSPLYKSCQDWFKDDYCPCAGHTSGGACPIYP
jgi:hypothetical protein